MTLHLGVYIQSLLFCGFCSVTNVRKHIMQSNIRITRNNQHICKVNYNAERVHKSLSIIMCSVGPTHEPCIIPEFICIGNESASPHLTTSLQFVRKEISQLRMQWGTLRPESLDRSTEWSTTSNAFEKSTSRHRTYSQSSNISVTWCRIKTRAHVVLPCYQWAGSQTDH